MNTVYKSKYKSGVDALRALSVILVLFYHAKLEAPIFNIFNSNGFVGVDIFFVISGYLITRILVEEYYLSNNISFSNFYLRRAKRLFPALFLMLIIVLITGFILLNSVDLVNLSKSSISSLFYISNIFFYLDNIAYGTESSFLKPLLHTWSLSIEEQFYLLFPLFLFFFFKIFKKIKILIFCLVFICFLLVIFSTFLAYKAPVFNFFNTISRSFELLSGAIFFLCEKKFNISKINKSIRKILFYFSLVFILLTIFFYNSNFHPSILTFILCFFTGLYLVLYNKEYFVDIFFSSKYIIKLGYISYSLYLWHFPIFAFARITDNFNNDFVKSIFIIISLVIALLSYKFIENPIRYKVSNKKFIIIILLAFLTTISISSYFVIKKGFPDRFPSIVNINNIDDRILNKETFKNCHKKKNSICKIYYSNDKSPNIYFIGDSHMASIIFDFRNKIKSKNYNLFMITSPGCYFGANITDRCNFNYQDIRKNIIKNDKNNKSIVIIGGRLPLYLERVHFDNLEGGIEGGGNLDIYKNFKSTDFINYLKAILSYEKKVILLYPIPEVGYNLPRKVFNIMEKNPFLKNKDQINKNILLEKPITTSSKVYYERSKSSFELLDIVIHENLFRVYPHNIFCDNVIIDRCITHSDEYLYYSDYNHPSVYGADLINNLLIDKINLIETNSK